MHYTRKDNKEKIGIYSKNATQRKKMYDSLLDFTLDAYLTNEDGEILWESNYVIPKMRKIMNYRQINITKKAELLTGKFGDQRAQRHVPHGNAVGHDADQDGDWRDHAAHDERHGRHVAGIERGHDECEHVRADRLHGDVLFGAAAGRANRGRRHDDGGACLQRKLHDGCLLAEFAR